MYRLSQRFRRRFRPKEGEHKKDKHSVEYKIVLLDDTDLTFNVHKKSKGQALMDLVFKNLDLVEKDYFGLQFMDTHQVGHWLDPTKKIKKQVKIGPPYTLHFRVKFYAAEPHDLGEELTRYHFFLQIKQDISRCKLEVSQRTAIDLAAYSLQSQLGDYDPEVHGEDYMAEFRFFPDQNKELEKEITKKHKALVGLNPAECEVKFLKIVKAMDFYGVNLHNVLDQHRIEYELGLTPRGIIVVREKAKVGLHYWPRIAKMTFKKKNYLLDVQEDRHVESYNYTLSSSQAAKHLWKCAVEHHTFFRLIKPTHMPKRTSSFLHFGSRFRYSGRTEYQTQKDARLSARKSMKFKRATSERFTKRSTIGYIRVGSRVWGKALNGDFYKGVVTGLGQMVHIKFDNGDTIAHDRKDPECVVFDMDPDPLDIEIGTRVIAHWPTLPAYLSGKVIGMEHHKYYVEYDDGDRHHNSVSQMRILKPPLYFGPGSDIRKVNLKKKSESMKVTSLTGRVVITTELPRVADKTNGSLKGRTFESDVTDTGASATMATVTAPTTVAQATVATASVDDRNQPVFAGNTHAGQDTKQMHFRSASLPSNVRVPQEKGSASSPVMDPTKSRNKSFAGMSKASKAKKPPLDIFSLPETDIDSGISVACETGRESRRNMRTFDLTKTYGTEVGEIGRHLSTSSNPETQRGQRKGHATSQTSHRPDIQVSRNAPYAPNFLEDSEGQSNSRCYDIDAQRSFHVYVPPNPTRWDYTKRMTYIGSSSASQDLLLDGPSRKVSKSRRSSLPDLRTAERRKLTENLASSKVDRTSNSKKYKTASLNDLAKVSPTGSAKNTPLHIDNLQGAGSPVDNEAPCNQWEEGPAPEQHTSGRQLQVTDL